MLNLDHRLKRSGQVWQRRLDMFPQNRTNWFRFLCPTPVSSQPLHAQESLVHRDWNQLFCHAPFEHSSNSPDVLVDSCSSDPTFDHLLTDNLKSQRPELADTSGSVERLEWSESETNAFLLTGGLAVLDIIRLGKFPVGGDEFHDGQIGTAEASDKFRDIRCLAVTTVLSNGSAVLLAAFGSTVDTEVMISATDSYNGLTTGFVVAVRGYLGRSSSHLGLLFGTFLRSTTEE